MAAVVWLMALALVVDSTSAAEPGTMAHLDFVGIAVAVLSAALVLSARLGGYDGPGPARDSIVDYTCP